MKLSISNIGWDATQDLEVYSLMHKYNFSGLEIAPTRIFPVEPYQRQTEAAHWSADLKNTYGFIIPSMQSIWFGRKEKLFGTQTERQLLLAYTKKAIDFAVAIGCKNLVFGCPVNRALPENADPEIAIDFFKKLGNYAADKGTIIGMEANPPIYHTNYINDTLSAFELIKHVNSQGFLMNLDVGTMIQNHESASELEGHVHLINHVHISEPQLKPIENRKLHMELKQVLTDGFYDKYISIEMGKVDNLSIIEEKMQYVRGVFQ